MGNVKSAMEKAMEKAAKIGAFTPEEKAQLKEQEELKQWLSEFYRGKLDRDGLWQNLKGKKPFLLREAQQYLVDSLGLSLTPAELKTRKDGILAIETLKETQRTPAIEQLLDSIEILQVEYQDRKNGIADELRAEIERNPQMRLQPVRTPDGRTTFQASLSVDEAVQAKLSEFLDEHEKVYGAEFMRMIYRLKQEIK
jgi:hypothetical protein